MSRNKKEPVSIKLDRIRRQLESEITVHAWSEQVNPFDTLGIASEKIKWFDLFVRIEHRADTEKTALRSQYGRIPARQIAEQLQLPIGKIYAMANRMGLSKKQQVATDEQIKSAIENLHPKGLPDSEIARRTGKAIGVAIDRHRVSRIRRAMGLASNAYSAWHRQQVAKRTREQLAQKGLKSLADERTMAFNKWKRSYGWPEQLTMRAVQSLELFYTLGPMTRNQLCDALGLPKKGRKRTAPTSNAKGGTVLAELARADLIVRLPKQIPEERRDGTIAVDLYFLSPGVEPNEYRTKPKPNRSQR